MEFFKQMKKLGSLTFHEIQMKKELMLRGKTEGNCEQKSSIVNCPSMNIKSPFGAKKVYIHDHSENSQCQACKYRLSQPVSPKKFDYQRRKQQFNKQKRKPIITYHRKTASNLLDNYYQYLEGDQHYLNSKEKSKLQQLKLKLEKIDQQVKQQLEKYLCISTNDTQFIRCLADLLEKQKKLNISSEELEELFKLPSFQLKLKKKICQIKKSRKKKRTMERKSLEEINMRNSVQQTFTKNMKNSKINVTTKQNLFHLRELAEHIMEKLIIQSHTSSQQLINKLISFNLNDFSKIIDYFGEIIDKQENKNTQSIITKKMIPFLDQILEDQNIPENKKLVIKKLHRKIRNSLIFQSTFSINQIVEEKTCQEIGSQTQNHSQNKPRKSFINSGKIQHSRNNKKKNNTKIMSNFQQNQNNQGKQLSTKQINNDDNKQNDSQENENFDCGDKSEENIIPQRQIAILQKPNVRRQKNILSKQFLNKENNEPNSNRKQPYQRSEKHKNSISKKLIKLTNIEDKLSQEDKDKDKQKDKKKEKKKERNQTEKYHQKKKSILKNTKRQEAQKIKEAFQQECDKQNQIVQKEKKKTKINFLESKQQNNQNLDNYEIEYSQDFEKNISMRLTLKKNSQRMSCFDSNTQQYAERRSNFSKESQQKKASQQQQITQKKQRKRRLSGKKKAMQHFKVHQQYISHVEQKLKNITNFVINVQDPILTKKKKIRALRQLCKNKKGQLDDNMLTEMFNYLQIYEQNCKLMMSKKKTLIFSQTKPSQLNSLMLYGQQAFEDDLKFIHLNHKYVYGEADSDQQKKYKRAYGDPSVYQPQPFEQSNKTLFIPSITSNRAKYNQSSQKQKISNLMQKGLINTLKLEIIPHQKYSNSDLKLSSIKPLRNTFNCSLSNSYHRINDFLIERKKIREKTIRNTTKTNKQIKMCL